MQFKAWCSCLLELMTFTRTTTTSHEDCIHLSEALIICSSDGGPQISLSNMLDCGFKNNLSTSYSASLRRVRRYASLHDEKVAICKPGQTGANGIAAALARHQHGPHLIEESRRGPFTILDQFGHHCLLYCNFGSHHHHATTVLRP